MKSIFVSMIFIITPFVKLLAQESPENTLSVPKTSIHDAIDVSMEKGSELFKKAMAAMGGEEALRNIRNIKESCQITGLTPGAEYTLTGELLVVYPDKIKWTVNNPQIGDFIMVLDGSIGWMLQPGHSNVSDLQEASINDNQRSLLRDPVNLILAENLTCQYIGMRELLEKETEDLLIIVDHYQFHMLLDPQTFIIVGTIYISRGGIKQEVVSDYISINDIQIASKIITWTGDQKESESLFTKIQCNIDIDPKIFEMP
jgi:hypothetical protein